MATGLPANAVPVQDVCWHMQLYPSFEKWELEFGLSAVWAEYCERIRAGRPRPQGADRPVAGDRTGRRRCSAAGYGLGRRILTRKPSVSLSIGVLVLAPAARIRGYLVLDRSAAMGKRNRVKSFD